MKKSSVVFNSILALAIVALYIVHFTDRNSSDNHTSNTESADQHASLRIAYIKMDSLLFSYDLARDLNADFAKKQEAYNKEYSSKRIDFEKQASAFQEKVQRGGFLTQDRAVQERDRLVGIEQEVKKLDYELSNKLAEIQAQINQQVVDSIGSFLKKYNEDNKYDLILNSSSLLQGIEQHNITPEITQLLNERYAKGKK